LATPPRTQSLSSPHDPAQLKRHGLIVIIALGEAVIEVGAGVP
jgi:low temperature requirement protein LtrA